MLSGLGAIKYKKEGNDFALSLAGCSSRVSLVPVWGGGVFSCTFFPDQA